MQEETEKTYLLPESTLLKITALLFQGKEPKVAFSYNESDMFEDAFELRGEKIDDIIKIIETEIKPKPTSAADNPFGNIHKNESVGITPKGWQPQNILRVT